jgi:NarL family two-component system response regulator LiaR
MVRRGLQAFLDTFADLELVGQAADGEQAVNACRDLAPDVVLMDLVMPRQDGIVATRIIRRECPETQVIALTSFTSDDLVRKALRAGAVSYLLKNVSPAQLAQAIRDAHAGRPVVSAEAAQALARRPDSPPPGADLTQREREVLGLLAEGLTNRQIGLRLSISEATTKAHVSNIIAKLGVSSRTEAVALAMRLGLAE